jgi:hypothetical protein
MQVWFLAGTSMTLYTVWGRTGLSSAAKCSSLGVASLAAKKLTNVYYYGFVTVACMLEWGWA